MIMTDGWIGADISICKKLKLKRRTAFVSKRTQKPNHGEGSILNEARSVKSVKRIITVRKILTAIQYVFSALCIGIALCFLFGLTSGKPISKFFGTTLAALVSAYPIFIALMIAVRIVKRIECKKTNEQIKRIQAERAAAPQTERVDTDENGLLDLQNSDRAETNEKTVNTDDRIKSMRKYIVFDIFSFIAMTISGMVVLFPFIKEANEKCGVINLCINEIRAVLNFSRSFLDYVVVDLLKINMPLAGLIYGMILFAIPASVMITGLQNTMRLIVAYRSAEINIKNEKIILTANKKYWSLKGSWIYIFIIGVFYGLLFFCLIKAIRENQNVSYSVTPVWLCVWAICFIAYMVLQILKRVNFKNTKTVYDDMIYFNVYRKNVKK